jgi:hypothetical protein
MPLVTWPPSYYADGAKVGVTADLDEVYDKDSPLWRWDLWNNTDRSYLYFTPYLYDNVADFIPGEQHEKNITIYIVEKRRPDADPITHVGPTVTLVKTAEFSSIHSKRKDDADDGRPTLSRAGIIGVVIASIVGACLLYLCCWQGCCGCCGPKRWKPRDDVDVEGYDHGIQTENLRLEENSRLVENLRFAENLRLAGGAGPARPARVVSNVPRVRQKRSHTLEIARPETWREERERVALERAENARIERVREELQRATSGEVPPVYIPETLPSYKHESPPPYQP